MLSSRKVGMGVKLTTRKDQTTMTLLWSSDKAALGMATPVLIGKMLVGARRESGSLVTQLLGVDIYSGKQLWADQVFPMSVAVGGAQSLVVLDHEGVLGLATATRKGLKIRSQHQVAERHSFTPPNLVGDTLYVRDEKQIMALDLGTADTEPRCRTLTIHTWR